MVVLSLDLLHYCPGASVPPCHRAGAGNPCGVSDFVFSCSLAAGRSTERCASGLAGAIAVLIVFTGGRGRSMSAHAASVSPPLLNPHFLFEVGLKRLMM